MLSWSVWANIAQRNYLRSVGPWLTDNFYEENNLHNVVSTILGQHCIGISYAPCCPNTSETTLHRKTTFVILALSAQTCYCRKIAYAMLSWSAWTNIAQTNYLCNAEQCLPTVHSLVNVFQIRLRQLCTRKLLMQSWHRAHSYIFTEKPAVSNINITKQSWLFLFNVGSRVHLRLAGQQWAGANIDRNII